MSWLSINVEDTFTIQHLLLDHRYTLSPRHETRLPTGAEKLRPNANGSDGPNFFYAMDQRNRVCPLTSLQQTHI